MNPLEQPTIQSKTPQLVRQAGLQSKENGHAEALRYALQRLRPDLRRVFLLREIERKSYREISVKLGIGEDSVGTQLSSARRLLIQYLAELD
jgi:RNA polymerase sigma factor (sigma-70 family)